MKSRTQPFTRTFFLIVSILSAVVAAEEPARRPFQMKPADPNEHLTFYYSTGDHNVMHYAPPVNTPQSVEENFTIAKKVYGVQRIFWRGQQAEFMAKECILRETDFVISDMIRSEREIFKKMPNRTVVAIAKKLGLEIWGIGIGFDLGRFEEEHAAKGYGPFAVQWKKLAENPHWAPVDRYGIRRKSGPVCYAYPEARKALAELIINNAAQAGYDGVMFQTFIESFETRVAGDEYDEFGFNEPIAAEYKKRYGTDILKESFDQIKLNRLRGEFFTLFLTELRKGLSVHGIKLGIQVGPIYNNYPSPWAYNHHMITGGLVYFDWELWIKNKIADELFIWCSGNPFPFYKTLVSAAEGSSTHVSIFSSSGFSKDISTADARRAGMAYYDSTQFGYMSNLSASDIDSSDFIARVTVLDQAGLKITQLPEEKIISLMKDPSVYVRRMAVIAAGKLELRSKKSQAAIIECLKDSEPGVHSYAAEVLVKSGEENSVREVYQMLDTYNDVLMNWMMVSALSAPAQTNDNYFRMGFVHNNPDVRKIALRAARSRYRASLLNDMIQMQNNSSAEVRWQLAETLGAYTMHREAREVLTRLLSDSHPTVSGMAALKLAAAHRSETRYMNAESVSVMHLLQKRFAEYTSAYSGMDKNWGWRCHGEALYTINPRGREILQSFLLSGDPALAHNAWYSYFMRINSVSWTYVTREQSENDYAMHPLLWEKPPVFEFPADPPLVHWLIQDFEGPAFSAESIRTNKGRVGNYHNQTGQWFTFGNTETDAQITDAPAEKRSDRKRSENQKNLSAVLLTKTKKGGSISVTRNPVVTEGKIYFAVKLFLESESGLYCRLFRNTDTSQGIVFRIENGELKYNDEKGAVISTGYKIPVRTWFEIRIPADIDKKTWSLLSSASALPLAENIPVGGQFTGINYIAFTPMGKQGSSVYLDDIVLSAENPFFSEQYRQQDMHNASRSRITETWISQNFEGLTFSKENIAENKGRVGIPGNNEGLWLTLGTEGEPPHPVSLPENNGRGKPKPNTALLLSKSGSGRGISVTRTPPIIKGKICFSFRFIIPDEKSGVYCRLFSSTDKGAGIVFRAENGNLKFNNVKGGIISSGYTLPLSNWVLVQIDIDMDKKNWSLSAEGKPIPSAVNIPAGEPISGINYISFTPIGAENSYCYIDDISVTYEKEASAAEIPDTKIVIDWNKIRNTGTDQVEKKIPGSAIPGYKTHLENVTPQRSDSSISNVVPIRTDK